MHASYLPGGTLCGAFICVLGGKMAAAPVFVTNPGGALSNTAWFGVATRGATLSGNVQPIFTARCATSGCHVSGSPTAPLSLQARQSYANLVGATSTGCPSTLRVRICGPLRTQSVLADKVLSSASSLPCSGSAMPKGAPLSASDKQAIIDWIAQGAPP